ncbi:hypothetical protein [Chitinophaga polysaccharea]|nr:hypothetical protein [Chitinophaga polysaccharea]
MRTKEKIPFTRLSSNFEIVKAEDLFSLKGGGESSFRSVYIQAAEQ